MKSLMGMPSELLDDLERQSGSAERVGGVDLVGAVAGDRHHQVAGHREHRDAARLGVEAHHHERVGAGADILGIAGASVAADDHDVHGPAGQCLGQLRLGGLHLVGIVAPDLGCGALQDTRRGTGRARNRDYENKDDRLEGAYPERHAGSANRFGHVSCVARRRARSRRLDRSSGSRRRGASRRVRSLARPAKRRGR